MPILETDFVDICEAMIDRELRNMQIEYKNKATVCKYTVNRGFPQPKELQSDLIIKQINGNNKSYWI